MPVRSGEYKQSGANLWRRAIFQRREPVLAKGQRNSHRPFPTGDGPTAALDNDAPATEPRCLRRQPELEWMKPKRNDPIAGKGTEILTTRAKGDVTIFSNENFSLRW